MMNEKTQAIATVNAAIPALRRIDELYGMAHNISRQSAETKERIAIRKAHRTSGMKAVLCLVALFGSLAIGSLLQFDSRTLRASIFLIALVAIFVKVYRDLLNQNRQDEKRLEQLLMKHDQQCRQISDEIETIAMENRDALNAIPRDYRYYYAVNFFENALMNGRADSMKETVNLFETHLHQMRVENASQNLLHMTEQQSRMMAEIECNTRDTRDAVNLNTAFNILYFLSR